MKRLNGYRMRLVLVGVVAVMVICSNAQADFTFGEITNLGPAVNHWASDRSASLSSDGLVLYHASDVPGAADWDIFTVNRETTEDDWGNRLNLGPAINTPDLTEMDPSISTDGLELYFTRGAVGWGIELDLFVATRRTTGDDWETAVNLGEPVCSPSKERHPSISGDGLSLYFDSNRPDGIGGKDLWVTTRKSRDDNWGAPVNLGPTINGSGDDFAPDITADGLTLVFSSDRPGSTGQYPDLWLTTRRSTSDPWREPINLGPTINTDEEDYADISPDGAMLYITYWGRSGGEGYDDVWQVPILPVVDFNGDGNVDSGDIGMMIDHWGEDYSLCDVGPTPLGNGVVDVKDLRILFECMSGYQPPIAHWTLDEKEGDIAHDKINGNNAAVYGDAMWFPTEGVFGGTLFLDGIDDYAITDPIRQHCSGSFSIVAWAKGWIPGRVIISQATDSNWLMADATGNLISEIKCVGRADRTDDLLLSEIIVTDGSWHRIALVWDGSQRKLYVDGALVAEDTQAGLEISDTGLNFGVGKDYEPETHWSGFLDDVRIYDVALSTEQIAALAQ